MSQTLVQINFKFNMSAAEYEAAVEPAAHAIAQLPGFQWKIWLMNEYAQEAGGIYLFDNAAAAQSYTEGPIVGKLAQMPGVMDIQVKQFGIAGNLTAITNGPLVGEPG